MGILLGQGHFGPSIQLELYTINYVFLNLNVV